MPPPPPGPLPARFRFLFFFRPGCKRVFDRVKSRSAHLKWHGGSYKESSSSAAQPGTPSEGAPTVVAEEADAPVTSAKRSSTGSGRSKPPAKKRAIAPLETGKPAIRTGSLPWLVARHHVRVCPHHGSRHDCCLWPLLLTCRSIGRPLGFWRGPLPLIPRKVGPGKDTPYTCRLSPNRQGL